MTLSSRLKPWIQSAWPGLPDLWKHGRLSGLLVAVVFAAVVQVFLLTVVVWPGVFPPLGRIVFGIILSCFWVVTVIVNLWNSLQTSPVFHEDLTEALLREAQGEYLKGNWFQAEALLREILTAKPADGAARIYLVGLFRRTSRIEEAREELRTLEVFDNADQWHPEIAREIQQLDRLMREHSKSPPETTYADHAQSAKVIDVA